MKLSERINKIYEENPSLRPVEKVTEEDHVYRIFLIFCAAAINEAKNGRRCSVYLDTKPGHDTDLIVGDKNKLIIMAGEIGNKYKDSLTGNRLKYEESELDALARHHGFRYWSSRSVTSLDERGITTCAYRFGDSNPDYGYCGSAPKYEKPYPDTMRNGIHLKYPSIEEL